MRNYTYDEWAAQDRAADERRHKRQQYELLDPLWDCQCIQTDVDEFDARGCREHGDRAAVKEQEAAELVAYYAVGPDLAARRPVNSTGGTK